MLLVVFRSLVREREECRAGAYGVLPPGIAPI
jgi:hypothetical protein